MLIPPDLWLANSSDLSAVDYQNDMGRDAGSNVPDRRQVT